MKFPSDLHLIIRVRRHPHHAHDLHVLHLLVIVTLQESFRLFHIQPELSFLTGYIKLQQARDHPIMFFPLLVNGLQQFQALHTMNQRNESGHILHFIRL